MFLNEYRRQDRVGAAFTHGRDSGVLRVELVCRHSALRLLLLAFCKTSEVDSDKSLTFFVCVYKKSAK